MTIPLSRRDMLLVAGSQCLATAAVEASPPQIARPLRHVEPGWVSGRMTGAEALVAALIQEGTECVYGLPGAQMNEIWDTFKNKHLDYLLATHEFSAACMADGYARSKGKPGVLCTVPGPGLTNALSGIGEALLDSIPMVCIVGDVAHGPHAHPFQVHDLPQACLLQQVTKQVIVVQNARQIPEAVRQAFCLARGGEPGPVGVVIPYNLLIEVERYHCGPACAPAVPWDEQAFHQALNLLSNRRLRVGIYAGQGCMDYSAPLVQAAEMLQAPVATSISGKGAMPENHPLAVGWGYGPQGTRAAEQAFRSVDLVLAIGVRYSEVSTGVYAQPQSRYLIHVDANPHNLGRILRTDVCVAADAGIFLNHLLAQGDCIGRAPNPTLVRQIQCHKAEEARTNAQLYAQCGADPMAFFLALRRCTCPDALVFVDVTCSQYWATEVFNVCHPRLFFNPTNNQSMGWSIPAAIGAQRVFPGRQTLTITGDGCFLMSAMEITTAARERLPVKFFILDDQAYHYMQALQRAAYLRTTATVLARLDYRALAQGWGVAYQEITGGNDLDASLRASLCHPGPVLIRVVTDYRRRPIRWIGAARTQFTRELTTQQKARFLARLGSRALDLHPQND
jgi:acetolactate synthase-1/2/3 large subunit